MGGTAGLIVTSIPLLALFGMGIYSLVLATMVEEELEARKEGQTSDVPMRPVREQSIRLDDVEQLPRVQAPEVASQEEVSAVNGLWQQAHVIEVLAVEPEMLEKEECVICMTNPRDTVFYPCGHQCLCEPCAVLFKRQARHQICPICRNRIKDTIKVFK